MPIPIPIPISIPLRVDDRAPRSLHAATWRTSRRNTRRVAAYRPFSLRVRVSTSLVLEADCTNTNYHLYEPSEIIRVDRFEFVFRNRLKSDTKKRGGKDESGDRVFGGCAGRDQSNVRSAAQSSDDRAAPVTAAAAVTVAAAAAAEKVDDGANKTSVAVEKIAAYSAPAPTFVS
ncbi:unnamed protein product, partial [Ilex paraguariensis]